MLLALFGSGESAVTEAVLIRVVLPRAVTFTTSVTVRLSPLPSWPVVQVTVPELPGGGVLRLPCVALALTKVVPRGSGSFITRLMAGPGPRFSTRMV
jgi:hypothetical protein